MKITRLKTEIVSLPLPTPIPSARMTIRSADCVLVFLETDAGPIGEGMAFTLNGKRLALVESMIRSLEPLIVGVEPSMSGAFWREALGDMAFLGQRGMTVVGLSAIDMALWDLREGGGTEHQPTARPVPLRDAGLSQRRPASVAIDR
jgi:L-alanine-DL-glutamate epimerase-like enolase superfamily enzyme